jgi:hypothetical protein
MAGEIFQFRCPCCGQHAPIERILEEGPFEFEVFKKVLGGKMPLTPEMRKQLKGRKKGRGRSPGVLDYAPIRTLKKHSDAMNKRIQEIGKG